MKSVIKSFDNEKAELHQKIWRNEILGVEKQFVNKLLQSVEKQGVEILIRISYDKNLYMHSEADIFTTDCSYRVGESGATRKFVTEKYYRRKYRRRPKLFRLFRALISSPNVIYHPLGC